MTAIVVIHFSGVSTLPVRHTSTYVDHPSHMGVGPRNVTKREADSDSGLTNIDACSTPIQDCFHSLSTALEGYDPCLIKDKCLEAGSSCQIVNLELPCQNILVMCSGLGSATTSNLLCGQPELALVTSRDVSASTHGEGRRNGPVNPEGQSAPTSTWGPKHEETTTATKPKRRPPQERIPLGPTTGDSSHGGSVDREGLDGETEGEGETPRVEGSTDSEWTQALSTREIILVAVACFFVTVIGLCICGLTCVYAKRRMDRKMMTLPAAFSARRPRRKGYFRTLYNGMAEGRQQAQLVKKLKVIERLLQNPSHVDYLFRNHKTLLTNIELSLWRGKFPPGLLATSGMGLKTSQQDDTAMQTVKEWSTQHRPTLSEDDKCGNPSTEALHSSTPSSSTKGKSKLEETSTSAIHRVEEGGEDDIRYAPDEE